MRVACAILWILQDILLTLQSTKCNDVYVHTYTRHNLVSVRSAPALSRIYIYIVANMKLKHKVSYKYIKLRFIRCIYTQKPMRTRTHLDFPAIGNFIIWWCDCECVCSPGTWKFTLPQSYVNGALARGRISVDWVRKTIYYTMGGCADVDWAACSTDVIKYIYRFI